MNSKQIMALTLHQPWASLVAWGIKRFETRSWSTTYRGKLIVHASANTAELKEVGCWLTFGRKPFYALLRETMRARGYSSVDDFPLGCGLCLVDLTDCFHMSWALIDIQSAQERECGLWEPGRYAWKLTNIRHFEQPIPAKGAQGLWKWTAPLPEGIKL